jgi:hypothetical protein
LTLWFSTIVPAKRIIPQGAENFAAEWASGDEAAALPRNI